MYRMLIAFLSRRIRPLVKWRKKDPSFQMTTPRPKTPAVPKNKNRIIFAPMNLFTRVSISAVPVEAYGGLNEGGSRVAAKGAIRKTHPMARP
jgi:hypothetical protein